MEISVQDLVDKHDCRYFIEDDTGKGDTMNVALRSPFTRLYALNRRPSAVAAQRARFQDNDRVQIFTWTHRDGWLQVVRLVPVEQPALVWLHGNEHIGRGVGIVARLRPYRTDVLVVQTGYQRGVGVLLEQCFGRTHLVTMPTSGVFVATPRIRGFS